MKFSCVLVFDFGISKGWHTILQNFQGWQLVFSGISKGKVTNLKIPEGGFRKGISTTQPVWSFSGIVQWTGEFHPKSQITILVAWQLKLFQTNWKKIPNRGCGAGAGFPTGVESMGGTPPPTLALQNLMGGAWLSTWREHGGLKTLVLFLGISSWKGASHFNGGWWLHF